MAYPEPLKPLGQKEADAFLAKLNSFQLDPDRQAHFRRLRDAAADDE